jgi:peptidoglycan/LPS O-acetylase OafA/YrhL
VLYRWTIGEVSGRTAASVYALAIVIIPIIHFTNIDTHPGPEGSVITWRVEALTFLVAYLLFGGVLLLRHHRFPRVLTYLGAISYSVYLLHVVVLYAVPWVGDNRVATFFQWVGLTLALSVCTYHLIEKPAIRLGRRVEAWYRDRALTPSVEVHESG